MTAEGHCNIVWGGDFKDTLRFQTSNFSFSFDATFRFADYKYMGSKTPKVRKIGKKVQFSLYILTILQYRDINRTVLQEKSPLCTRQVSSSFTL